MDTALEFTNRLVTLLRAERHAMAEFLVALAEFDRRGLYRERGHTSLFSFLHRELKLSAGSAQLRKTAAELIQRYPAVERALREGKLCLSSVCELAKVVTTENCADVLPRFFGRSSRDAAAVVASIRPVENPPRREVVVPLRVAGLAVMPAVASREVASPEPGRVVLFHAHETPRESSVPTVTRELAAAPPPVAKPSSVDWLESDRARMHLTVSRAFLEKLDAARDALSHAMPGASREHVLEAALDHLLAERARRKGLTPRPRKAIRPSKPDHSAGATTWRPRAGCSGPR